MISTQTALRTDAIQIKYSKLKAILKPKLREGLIVAFSGGVDSSFLIWAAEQQRLESGGKLLALTTLSASFSRVEKLDAERFAADNSIRHVWFESRELLNPAYTVNDIDRCFYCKTELFNICREAAAEYGIQWIAYGYNASDRGDTRPGHKAAVENAILSPLAEADLSKDEIRQLMRENGLGMSEKPASPCLSSRLMTGVFITPEKLRDVEEIEAILRDGGLRVFRVRLHDEAGTKFLRIEVAPDEMEMVLPIRERLVTAGRRRGYKWIMLDLAGYMTGGGNLAA